MGSLWVYMQKMELRYWWEYGDEKTRMNSIEIREMISFELGKEIKKDFFRLVTSVGERKILSIHEESNLRLSDFRATTEPQRLYGERGLLRSLYDTHPAHC